MKRLLFIIFSLFSITLFPQFNDPVLIGENIQLCGQNAAQIIDNNIYTTYLTIDFPNNEIWLAFSENNGTSYNQILVDSMENSQHYYNNFDVFEDNSPALTVSPDGQITIIYSKIQPDSTIILFKAVSDDNGSSFEINPVVPPTEGIFETPSLFSTDNDQILCYKTGRTEQLAEYEYFTHIQEYENASDGNENARVRPFWGQDEFCGKVHSNDDIWVGQFGGGNNNGWPTFHEIASTSGIFKYYPTGQPLEEVAPMDDIFLKGWTENVYHKNVSCESIRANGLHLFPPDVDIVYVKLNGSGFYSKIAYIEFQEIREFDVYSWYPSNAEQVNEVIDNGGNWFEDSDNVWTNYIADYDTIWSEGPSIVEIADQSIWVDCELWIEGEVSGNLTIGCADTVYIVGDITYTNTVVGEAPDDLDNPNLTDYFGLVSEEKILIKYKHRDPFNNNIIRNDNCNDVVLYGAFAALGQGDPEVHGEMACHYDGIFSFEYQHPHGSTPSFFAPSPYTGNDTLYSNIDLHKYIFPVSDFVPPDLIGFNLHGNYPVPNYGMCGYPYESEEYLNSYPNNGPDYLLPYGTDHPFYNPVWPESAEDIVTERGTIRLFGSIAQTRCGFVHRSGMDPYNHPEEQEWDLDNFHYDGSHPSTGYDKDYHFDSRLLEVQPVDYPHILLDGIPEKMVILKSDTDENNYQAIFETEIGSRILKYAFDVKDEIIVCAYQSSEYLINFLYSENYGVFFDHRELLLENDLQNFHLGKIKIFNDELYILGNSADQDMIILYDLSDQEYQVLAAFDSEYHLSDFNISDNGERIYINAIVDEPNEQIDIHYSFNTNDFIELSQLYPFYVSDPYHPDLAMISVDFSQSDSLFINFHDKSDPDNFGKLYSISGYLDDSHISAEEIENLDFIIKAYPNPFYTSASNPEMNIKFEFSKPAASRSKITIFNLKGQKIRQLQIEEGRSSINWNGTDELNKVVGSGIYFYRFESGQHSEIRKMLVIR